MFHNDVFYSKINTADAENDSKCKELDFVVKDEHKIVLSPEVVVPIQK